jgi:hypothetical protein
MPAFWLDVDEPGFPRSNSDLKSYRPGGGESKKIEKLIKIAIISKLKTYYFSLFIHS